jgi:hypothetical protein
VALEGRRDRSVRRQAAAGLEEENRKLKRLLAEHTLDAATSREMLGKDVLRHAQEGRL